MLGRAVRIARALPGVAILERFIESVELQALMIMREREDTLVGPRALPPGESPRAIAERSGEPPGEATPAELLAELLRRSLEQSAGESGTSHFEHILRRLLPDQARILAALADGSTYPVVDVVLKSSRRRGYDRPLVENVSTVVRRASVSLPARGPAYLSELRVMGLVELGPEEPSLTAEYDILETENFVREAKQAAAAAGRRGAVVIRRSIRITNLGRELWIAAEGSIDGRARATD
jgi:hypothetical protein